MTGQKMASGKRIPATRVGVILTTKDVSVSTAFYAEHLGFDVEATFDEPPYVILQRNGMRLSLNQAGPAAGDLPAFAMSPLATPATPPLMLVIEVTDIDDVYAGLVAAGVTIESAVFRPPWGGARFFISDPDGYVIEIEQL
jgi:catechol 2,3-dioxygenase-like lactoylglutathione lyase family enzyme